VRGVASLPHGTGKRVVVAVFAKGEKAEEARRAGASIVGDVDLAERILKGDISFTKAIATPDMMPVVGRVARVLGPRGLMPNPKLGTVTLAVKEAVAAAMRGQAEFRSEKRGIVASSCGKTSFSEAQLLENLRALAQALYGARPESFKGVFMRSAFLSSTHGPGVPVEVALIDPSSSRFMAPWDGVPQHVAELKQEEQEQAQAQGGQQAQQQGSASSREALVQPAAAAAPAGSSGAVLQ
jgi:large subunit ribosomal protein L1